MSGMASSLVWLLLMLQLFSGDASSQGAIRLHSSCQDLRLMEEESNQVPLPRNKHANTLIDEFLDERSAFRHAFFPDITSAIDVVKDVQHDRYYRPRKFIWIPKEIRFKLMEVMFNVMKHPIHSIGMESVDQMKKRLGKDTYIGSQFQ